MFAGGEALYLNLGSEAVLFGEVSVANPYKIVIPFFWAVKAQWLLFTVESRNNQIHFVFPKFTDPQLSQSNADNRANLTLDRLAAVIAEADKIAPDLEAPKNNEPAISATATADVAPTIEPRRWTVVSQDPEARISASCHRAPAHSILTTISCILHLLPGCVVNPVDSGIYIAYAIKCDWFDAPIFAQDADWESLRINFAYWVLNSQLLL